MFSCVSDVDGLSRCFDSRVGGAARGGATQRGGYYASGERPRQSISVVGVDS